MQIVVSVHGVQGKAVEDANTLTDNLLKVLPHETFYLLAREMQVRLFNVQKLTLSKWLAEGVDRQPVDSLGGIGDGGNVGVVVEADSAGIKRVRVG